MFRTRLGAIPAITLVVWALFYATRPFRLGFFADDWTFIVAWSEYDFNELLNQWRAIMPARPIGRWTLSLLTYGLGAVAHWWHVALAAFSLLNSVLIYEITRRLAPDRERYVIEADIAAACWLLMPWVIGTTTWPILIIAQISVTFLLLSCLSIQAIAIRWLASLLSALCFAGSLLTYEVFHGQFFAVLFIGAVYAQSRTSTPRDLVRSALLPCFALLTAQGAVLVYTAFVGLSKARHAEWLSTWWLSFSRLPSILFQDIGMNRRGAELLLIAAIVGLIFSLRASRYSEMLRSALALFVLTAAIAVAAMVFAVGGYGLSGAGHMSRTTLAISVWVAIGIFFLAEASRSIPSINLFGIPSSRLASVPLLLILAFTYFRAQSDWIEASSRLDRFLRRAPVEKLAALPFGASLVYLGSTANRRLPSIDAYEVGVGLALYHRQLTSAGKFLAPIYPNERRTVTWTGRIWTRAENVRLRWDGKLLISTLPGYWEFSAPVSRLFIWAANDDTIREVEPGWSSDREVEEPRE